MRLWIFSDLHLDVNAAWPYALPDLRPDHDAVVIAGDLREGMTDGVRWIAEQGLAAKPVIYVGGNHEFYGHDRHKELAAARRVADDHANIRVLDGDTFELEGYAIHGATLWTDYELAGDAVASMRLAERMMSDHRLIADGSAKWSASAARREHLQRVEWLAGCLARRPRSRNIVVSHHAPSLRSSARQFLDHPLTAAFVSDLEPLLTETALWVHGHTHARVDYERRGCRVVNNPRGYVRREQTGFDPAFVLEL